MLHPAIALLGLAVTAADTATMPSVAVAANKKGFLQQPSGRAFVPWGFNYDHDRKGRLLEDYWEAEWPTVEADFHEMKHLGANVVRIHLQVGKFMEGADKPNAKALDRLGLLLKLAERERLYLDLTGLGCYHKKDVPAWYGALEEKGRWDAQARFWEAIAGRCAGSPAVFCYDLMNEPVVPDKPRAAGDWLAPPFFNQYFSQYITLDAMDRPRSEVAVQWIRHLVAAIRKHDPKRLVTVGLLDWSLDRPGPTTGFVPEKVAPELDFLCVHLYPIAGKVDDDLEKLKAFNVGKPVVIEEMYPLRAPLKEFLDFLDKSKPHAAGWVSFYWGETPEELAESKVAGKAVLRDWLLEFQKRAKAHGPP